MRNATVFVALLFSSAGTVSASLAEDPVAERGQAEKKFAGYPKGEDRAAGSSPGEIRGAFTISGPME